MLLVKYQQGKIKREHHTLKEFDSFLLALAKLPYVQRIIPGRISRKQQAGSGKHLTFSYTTPAGLKLHMKKGGTAQELFVTCKKEDKEELLQDIKRLDY